MLKGNGLHFWNQRGRFSQERASKWKSIPYRQCRPAFSCPNLIKKRNFYGRMPLYLRNGTCWKEAVLIFVISGVDLVQKGYLQWKSTPNRQCRVAFRFRNEVRKQVFFYGEGSPISQKRYVTERNGLDFWNQRGRFSPERVSKWKSTPYRQCRPAFSCPNLVKMRNFYGRMPLHLRNGTD